MGTVVRIAAPGEVEFADEPDQPLPATGVRVRTLFSGISAGTELTQYRGTNPNLVKTWDPTTRLFRPGPPTVEYPAIVGYEEVGEITATGEAVTTVHPGQTVWGVWGHRSTSILDEKYAATRTLDPSTDPLVGIFSHIGSVALNVVLDANIHVGETIAVFGLGVLGQLTAQLAQRNGAQVIAIDAIPARLDLASELGAENTLDAREGEIAERVRGLTAGRGADVVLETSGNHLALHEAVRTVAYNSRVVVAGFFQGEATGLFLGEEFHANRVQLMCSQISGINPALAHRWDRDRLATTVIDLAEAGKLAVRPLVSHIIPASKAPEAYELLATRPAEALQVVLQFEAP